MKKLTIFSILVVVSVLLAACSAVTPAAPQSVSLAEAETESVVLTEVVAATKSAAVAATWNGGMGALFEQKCASCHGAAAGINLQSYASAMKGGEEGAVIVPGKSADSLLVKVQSAGNHPGLFTSDELAKVMAWIDAGALEK